MKKYFIFLFLIVGCASKAPVESAMNENKRTSKSTKVAAATEPKSSQEMLKSKTIDPVIEKEPVKVDESQADVLKKAIQDLNDEAIFKSASQILYQSPNDIVALNSMGLYYYRKKQYSAAVFIFNKALGLQPDRSELHSNLGLCLIAQGERRSGILELKKSLELNENNASANVNLGSIYVADKDYSKALITLDKAYTLGVRDLKFLNNYGVTLVANEKYEKALEIYKLATKDTNSQRDTLFNMAILMIDHMGKFKEGLEIIGRLKFVGASEYRTKLVLLEEKAKQEIK